MIPPPPAPPAGQPPVQPHEQWVPRRADRSIEGSYLGGVSGGLARHLGARTWVVRLFFAVTAFFGLGIALYAALWLVLPLEAPRMPGTPGLDAATRQGKRTARRSGRLSDAGLLVAGGLLVLGIAGFVDALLGGLMLFWPAVFAVVGVMVLWRQADEAQRERWLDTTGRVDVRRVVLGDGGFAAWARLLVGSGLLLSALLVFAAQSGRISVARDVLVAAALGVLGLGLTLGPWLIRLAADLGEERSARVRSQERADVAAHLHDSVLQTLALIQKSAGDAQQVARLARAQERDLRRWMYDETSTVEGTVAAALRRGAAHAEDAYGVPVELVTVGDAALTAPLEALTQAAAEAMANAARHAGAPQVDVYAEVASTAGEVQAEVFVRDRGCGFDPAAVPHDRLGLRNSVVARMERHGGSAEVRTAPGEGTEVRLRMRQRTRTEEGR